MQNGTGEDLGFKKKWFEYIGYEPHEGQRLLHFPDKQTASFFVCICGRRYGKTTAAYREAEFYAAQPNKKIWLVGLSYKKSRLMFREIWKDMVIGHDDDIKSASEKEQHIEFKWGSMVSGMSADNPNSLVGEGLDLLIVDEAAKMSRKIWDMYLSPTLSDKKGKAIFISTPEGYNWLYDLYLLGKTDEQWHSMRFPSWVNNHAFPSGKNDNFILERKRNLAKEVFEQEYAGEFSTFEGKVYPFNREIDSGDFPFVPERPTYCSIDFGYRMPSVLWFQTYTQGGIVHINIIDEIVHQRNIPTEKLAKKILEREYPIYTFYGDPSGVSVQGQSGLGDIEIFRRSGVYVRYLKDRLSRNIASGVAYARGFFESADGLRRIHIDKKCTGVMEDFENYRYPAEAEGKSLSLDPIKDGYHDHSADAFRYFIVNRFPIRRRGINKIKR
jgi:hypothetical protein|tara:strand:- start:3584 stop:4906 length:1323 start_codon:yes stop_codon:yes gene_type:complete